MGFVAKIELNDDQMSELVQSLADDMVARGIALTAPERTRPFTLAEASREFGVSSQTVKRWVDAGMLSKVSGSSRVLIPVESVRAKQREGCE